MKSFELPVTGNYDSQVTYYEPSIFLRLLFLRGAFNPSAAAPTNLSELF